MRKTIALMAVLGLVTTAAAFAAETTDTSATATTPNASADVKADATTPTAKTETKADAKKDSKMKPAAGKHKHKKPAEQNSTQQ